MIGISVALLSGRSVHLQIEVAVKSIMLFSFFFLAFTGGLAVKPSEQLG